MRNADVAMYSAKARGKGQASVFEPHMAVAVATRHQLTASLQRAAAAGEFILNYQPIVEIADGQIVGVEALVRWEDPSRAARSGRSSSFRWPRSRTSSCASAAGSSRRRAARRSAGRRAFTGDGRARMSVNISTRQLQQPGFVDEVIEIVRGVRRRRQPTSPSR